MKKAIAKNVLLNVALSVVENSRKLDSGKNIADSLKGSTRELADSLINEFVEQGKLAELPQYLTDAFSTFKSRGHFGYLKGNKSGSMSNLQQNSARFFERSSVDLELDDKLTGYAPFKWTPIKEKLVLTNHEKLTKTLEEIGADIPCISSCIEQYELSYSRTLARREQAVRMTIELEKERKVIASQNKEEHDLNTLMSSKLVEGLTIEQVKKALKLAQKAS